MKTVYLMSGGKSSTLAAYHHLKSHSLDNAVFYFNDTLIESNDFVDTQALWNEFHSVSSIEENESYRLGFIHDNCGAMCVKSGLKQLAALYRVRPLVYLWHEEQMEQAIDENPKLKPFLKKMIAGQIIYLTLKQYREQYLDQNIPESEPMTSTCGCAL